MIFATDCGTVINYVKRTRDEVRYYCL